MPLAGADGTYGLGALPRPRGVAGVASGFGFAGFASAGVALAGFASAGVAVVGFAGRASPSLPAATFTGFACRGFAPVGFAGFAELECSTLAFCT
ncbi:MAG TPA: hypothetical protein VH300_13805 [Thermoleophilaceae bacterium]|nr:hypothetical protein [Thermoleophilaceae bacterium]